MVRWNWKIDDDVSDNDISDDEIKSLEQRWTYMSLNWPFLMTCVDEILSTDTEGTYAILIQVLEGLIVFIPVIEPVNH